MTTPNPFEPPTAPQLERRDVNASMEIPNDGTLELVRYLASTMLLMGLIIFAVVVLVSLLTPYG